MTRERYDDDEENEDVLKDGQVMRVPLMMRDGLTDLQRSVRDAALARDNGRLLVTDGAGGSAGLHRPGFRFIADAAARERAFDGKEAAYAEAEQRDAAAWRGALPSPGAHGRPPGSAPLDQVRHDRQELLDERERAYIEREIEDQNAWRNPR